MADPRYDGREQVKKFTDLGFPVRKNDLRDDIRKALANGYGNAGMRPEADGVPFQFLPPGATWVKAEESS